MYEEESEASCCSHTGDPAGRKLPGTLLFPKGRRGKTFLPRPLSLALAPLETGLLGSSVAGQGYPGWRVECQPGTQASQEQGTGRAPPPALRGLLTSQKPHTWESVNPPTPCTALGACPEDEGIGWAQVVCRLTYKGSSPWEARRWQCPHLHKQAKRGKPNPGDQRSNPARVLSHRARPWPQPWPHPSP